MYFFFNIYKFSVT